MFIIRCLVKYIIETGSEYQLLQHFEAIPTAEAILASVTQTANITKLQIDENVHTVLPTPVDGSKFESFFDAVVNLIVVIPVKYFIPMMLFKTALNCFFFF